VIDPDPFVAFGYGAIGKVKVGRGYERNVAKAFVTGGIRNRNAPSREAGEEAGRIVGLEGDLFLEEVGFESVVDMENGLTEKEHPRL
jgi:hypothetical protein